MGVAQVKESGEGLAHPRGVNRRVMKQLPQGTARCRAADLHRKTTQMWQRTASRGTHWSTRNLWVSLRAAAAVRGYFLVQPPLL